MNNYLLQLLKEVKTIIIPGLGALTLTNPASGEMMFMNYLKFDDGTLAKHISEKEGIELNEASNRIAKFVREVQAEIDKGGSYNMYQFGSFRKENGEIVFQQWQSNTPEAPKEITPPVLISEEPEISVEAEAGEIPAVIVVPEPETAQPAAEAEKELIEEEISAEIVTGHVSPENVKMDEPEVELTAEGFDTEHAAPVPQQQPQAEELPSPLPVNDVPEEVKEDPNVAPSPKDVIIARDRQEGNADNSPLREEKKKKAGALTYILWGIVVLILGAATYVAVNYDSMKQKFPMLAELAGEDTLNITRTKPALQPADTALAENGEPVAPDTMAEPEPVTSIEPAAKPVETTPPPVSKPQTTKTVTAPKAVEKPVYAKPVPATKPVAVSKPVTASKPVAVSKPVTASKPAPVVKAVSKPRSAVKVAKTDNLAIGTADPAKPFHVIGGSFSSEENARKFARTMIRKGSNAVVLGQQNGMFRVSLAGFATKDEAVNALGYLHSFEASAWVLKWP